MQKSLLNKVRLLVVFAIVGLVFPLLGFPQGPGYSASNNSLVFLKKNFANPGKEYGSAPLWVWHTKVTRAIIDSMLVDFKKNAFGGVFVHPRPGLITEYLSNDWFDLFQYAVKKGKELGLNVWIYDENSYPSGFAGGLLPEQMPESYNQGQMLHEEKLDVLPASTKNIFVCLREDKGKFTDISSVMEQEKGKKGKYYLFTKDYYGKQQGMVGPPEFPYVDLMVKGVTEKFIAITEDGYKKVVGSEFGKTVPGVFSDEPSIPSRGEGNIRWTPDLFTTFQKIWGYSLAANLPSLFEEVGNWKKVRHDYQHTLLQLFIDRWSKPMYQYAEQNHLKWTGHYWEHGWPSPGEGPDNMAMYAWHQQPGIDMLFNQFNENSVNAQFGNIRSVKELRSAANQLGKERTLCETYGGGGWELTFKDMKRLGDWEFVLGVNFLNQHLSMMTLTGARKYDYPQSFSYHNPNWPYYGTLNQYFARLSFALSHGDQKNELLIIEPTTSAWMYSVSGKKNNRLNEIGHSFQSFITRLEKSQVEYDLGSEQIIRDHGRVAGRKYIVGQRSYGTILIPPGMENIDRSTFKLLQAFGTNGGRVLMFEKLQTIDGAPSTELETFLASSKNIQQLPPLNRQVIGEYFHSEDFEITPTVNDSIGGDLYHQRRIMKDGQLLFLTNASMDKPSKGCISIKGKDALIMDLFTGRLMDYPEQEESGKLKVNFEIPPAGSLLLFIADKKQQGLPRFYQDKKLQAISSGELKVLRPKENTLMIDFCDLQTKGTDSVKKDMHVVMASKAVFRKYGFTRDPWDHQVQFRDHIVARDTFSNATGFTATYRFTIDPNVEYEKFRGVIEQGQLWSSIRVNGKEIKPVKGEWWLDRSFSVLALGSYLKAGENTLSITASPMSVFAEIEPVYILGDFNLQAAEKGFRIVAPQPMQPGSWKSQGLLLYGQGISYVKDVYLNNTGRQVEVKLGNWKGTVAAVLVNGVKAGIITSEPNTLNITPYLKKGNNRIEVAVIGSLKNLLGPHHNNPKPGLVGPGHWGNVHSYPSGNNYDTYDYGLMDDFEIVSFK